MLYVVPNRPDLLYKEIIASTILRHYYNEPIISNGSIWDMVEFILQHIYGKYIYILYDSIKRSLTILK
jgi:hypothetical protein